MKKILKKLSCALLAAAMVCAMTPLAASAAINYSKTRIVYMPTSGKDLGYDEISISNIPAKQNILKSNVKVVSGGSVIALDSFGSSSFKSTTEAFRKGAKPYTHSDHFYNIGFAVKKPGTGKISFKVGNKTYTSTIKVLRYVNPLKSVSITGVKGNLAGKFKRSGHNAFRYANKAQKNAVMKCTAANGWKITGVSLTTTGPIHSIVPITTPLTAGLLLPRSVSETFPRSSPPISASPFATPKTGRYSTVHLI